MLKHWQLSFTTLLILGLSCNEVLCAEAESKASTGPLSASGLGQWFLSMLGVLALILVLAYFLKRSRFVNRTAGEMSVVGQLALGPKERLVQVKIGERQILVGVGAGAVSFICDLTDNAFNQDLNKARAVQDLDALIAKSVTQAVEAATADLKAEVKASLAALEDKRAGEPDTSVEQSVALEKAVHERLTEIKENEEIGRMQADTSTEHYEFSSLPNAPTGYTIVDPHAPAVHKVKPYEFKPLPSEKDFEPEPTEDERKPSQMSFKVDVEEMKRLEAETAPRPEDYVDEEGNPIPRPHYYRAPFKRQIIGSHFSGRSFIG